MGIQCRAVCDKCGRIQKLPMTGVTGIQKALQKDGWKLIDKQTICPQCRMYKLSERIEDDNELEGQLNLLDFVE